MSFLNVKNNANSTLASDISDSDLSLTVATGEGALFPTANFNITIGGEILFCSSRTGDVLTVVRAQEDTSAAAHSAGNAVGLRITAKIIKDLSDEANYADSPMVVSGGAISKGTTGTFTVAAGTGLFRTTDSVTGALAKASWSEFANQSIPAADTTYFVYLNYNSGTPTLNLSETNPYAADKRNLPIGQVMKDSSGNIHFISGGFGFQDGVKKLHQRAVTLRNLELDGGSTIAYKATDYFTMAAGIAFGGINKFDLTAYDSSTTTYIPIRTNGATFIEDTPRKTIDYAHYDKQDGTLGTIGNNKYGVFWIYKHIDDEDVYVRYGVDSYSLAEAQATKEPSKPDHLTDFGCLIGRIVVPYDGGEFTTIDMVTDRFFVGTAVGDHNELGNLQGGTADEYYHLTSTEHTKAQNALNNVVEDTTPQAGGEFDFQAHSAGFTQQAATGDGTTTINWKLGNKFKFTFGSQNETFTFTAPSKPCNLVLVMVQDGTGSRTATWPSSVKWAGGSAPTLSTAANAIDVISFYFDGTNYLGVITKAFA